MLFGLVVRSGHEEISEPLCGRRSARKLAEFPNARVTALTQLIQQSTPETSLASGKSLEVKILKLQSEFVLHSHPETDELFLVVEGELTIQLRDSKHGRCWRTPYLAAARAELAIYHPRGECSFSRG